MKKIKKRHFLGLLAFATLIGTVFGAFIVYYTWETTMTMKLLGDATIELQYDNGTAISSYDWGLFVAGQKKTLQANIVNIGDMTVNMTWGTTINTTAWDLTIDYTNATAMYLWNPGDNWGPVGPGGGIPLNINMTEADAVAGVDESFSLYFYSGEGS